MIARSDVLEESLSTSAPTHLVERASALIRNYPECFWFWHPDARVRHLEDVRLVIEHLREYGGHRAWWAAQELHRCLSEEEATFRKAKVSRADQSVEIDWAADSACRFFPIERDRQLGWRLHLFDVATNKALSLSARSETRDYVDIVELHKRYPLPAICWAACGKDPGFSPLFLLKMMKRFARLDPAKLEEIQARSIDPVALKVALIEMSDQAEVEMIRAADQQPDLPIGVAFVDADGKPGWIGDDPSLRPHAASVRGCWPVIHGLEA